MTFAIRRVTILEQMLPRTIQSALALVLVVSVVGVLLSPAVPGAVSALRSQRHAPPAHAFAGLIVLALGAGSAAGHLAGFLPRLRPLKAGPGVIKLTCSRLC